MYLKFCLINRETKSLFARFPRSFESASRFEDCRACALKFCAIINVELRDRRGEYRNVNFLSGEQDASVDDGEVADNFPKL